MSPLHDVDVLLLLATSLAAKRRPAETGEIVAAIDLVNGNVPGEEKLAEAFARLGTAGLLVAAAGAIGLSPAAEGLIEILPRKGDHAQRLFELRGLLGAYRPAEEAPAITVAATDLRAAILAHRAAAAGPAKNLLVPKPKPETSQARPGQRQRKPLAKGKPRPR